MLANVLAKIIVDSSLSGIGSVNCFQGIPENNHNLMPEQLVLVYTGITEIPEFILQLNTMNYYSMPWEKS